MQLFSKLENRIELIEHPRLPMYLCDWVVSTQSTTQLVKMYSPSTGSQGLGPSVWSHVWSDFEVMSGKRATTS